MAERDKFEVQPFDGEPTAKVCFYQRDPSGRYYQDDQIESEIELLPGEAVIFRGSSGPEVLGMTVNEGKSEAKSGPAEKLPLGLIFKEIKALRSEGRFLGGVYYSTGAKPSILMITSEEKAKAVELNPNYPFQSDQMDGPGGEIIRGLIGTREVVDSQIRSWELLRNVRPTQKPIK